MYFYIKMSSVIIVGKILTAYITMAIWIGKQKFSVQKVTSIKLLVTLPNLKLQVNFIEWPKYHTKPKSLLLL